MSASHQAKTEMSIGCSIQQMIAGDRGDSLRKLLKSISTQHDFSHCVSLCFNLQNLSLTNRLKAIFSEWTNHQMLFSLALYHPEHAFQLSFWLMYIEHCPLLSCKVTIVCTTVFALTSEVWTNSRLQVSVLCIRLLSMQTMASDHCYDMSSYAVRWCKSPTLLQSSNISLLTTCDSVLWFDLSSLFFALR